MDLIEMGMHLNGDFRCYSIFTNQAVVGIDPAILIRLTKRQFVSTELDEGGRVLSCEIDGFVRMNPEEIFFCWTLLTSSRPTPGSIRVQGGRCAMQLLPQNPVAGGFFGIVLFGIISPGDNISVFHGRLLPIAELSFVSDGRDKRHRRVFAFKTTYRSEI